MSRTFWALALCTACADHDAPDPAPDSIVAPQVLAPRDPSAMRDFGTHLGGERELFTPQAGDYRVEFSASAHRFITTERRVHEYTRGGAFVRLSTGGRVHTCFWGSEGGGGEVGRYASKDGKDHFTKRDSPMRFAAWGQWRADESGKLAILEFTRMQHGDCELDPAEDRSYELPELASITCHALAARPPFPGRTLACTGEEHPNLRWTEFALLLAGTGRDGSWKRRHDLSLRGTEQLPEDAGPWLLLGQRPGLKIRSEDSREHEAPKLDISTGEVEVPLGPMTQRQTSESR